MPAQVWRWAGVWAGFTTGLADVALPVVAHGLEQASWSLVQADPSEYHFDAGNPSNTRAPPLGTVGRRRGPLGGGAWPLHRDHARLLTT